MDGKKKTSLTAGEKRTALTKEETMAPKGGGIRTSMEGKLNLKGGAPQRKNLLSQPKIRMKVRDSRRKTTASLKSEEKTMEEKKREARNPLYGKEGGCW